SRSLSAEAGLTDAENRLAVAAKLAVGRCDSRGSKRCVPVGVDALEILDRIELHETIELQVVVSRLPWALRRILDRRRRARYAQRRFNAANSRLHLLYILERLRALLRIGDCRGRRNLCSCSS